MWESPVDIFEIQEPIVEEINKQTEEVVFKAIHKVGVDVNKEELIKALQYDRNQYEKGYVDGYADAIDEFAERIKKEAADGGWNCHSVYSGGCDYISCEKCESSFLKEIDEIAEQMKGGE